MTKISSDDKMYVYEVIFDDDSTSKVKIQKKAFGSLKDYPKFDNVSVKVYMRPDFTPVK